MVLTRRELECLTGIANGKKTDAVGHSLGIHKKTVEKHLASGRKKLNAQTTAHAVALAVQVGALKVKK
jgi:LuxR family transcriptional regulator, quorum-sensing system regulator BjaR1